MPVHNFSMPMEFFIRILCGHDNVFEPLFCSVFTTGKEEEEEKKNSLSLSLSATCAYAEPDDTYNTL